VAAVQNFLQLLLTKTVASLDRILKDRLGSNRLGQDAPAFQFVEDASRGGVKIRGTSEDHIRVRRRFFLRLAHVDGDDRRGMDQRSDRLGRLAIGQAEGIGRRDDDQTGVGK
jgi:hypothetical protein